MTKATVCGIKIFWGMAKLPNLPEGFEVRQNHQTKALAIGPGGKVYLIADNPPRLIPRCEGKTDWFDFKNPILL